MKITEHYVSYEVAKLLKEKGFDGVCRYYYPDSHTNLVSYVDFVGADNGYLYEYHELYFNLNYESKKKRN